MQLYRDGDSEMLEIDEFTMHRFLYGVGRMTKRERATLD